MEIGEEYFKTIRKKSFYFLSVWTRFICYFAQAIALFKTYIAF